MKPLIASHPPLRPDDAHGQGHYGASRGDRTHKGIDYVAEPGDLVLAPCNGTVTKNGFPYSDDLSYRYVEVTDDKGNRVRCFYVDPMLAPGEPVFTGDPIGRVQNVGERYPGITPHIHFEILDEDDEPIDPSTY